MDIINEYLQLKIAKYSAEAKERKRVADEVQSLVEDIESNFGFDTALKVHDYFFQRIKEKQSLAIQARINFYNKVNSKVKKSMILKTWIPTLLFEDVLEDSELC